MRVHVYTCMYNAHVHVYTHVCIVHTCTCTCIYTTPMLVVSSFHDIKIGMLCREGLKWLLPHVRITKLHCYCKHSVICIGRARAQFG